MSNKLMLIFVGLMFVLLAAMGGGLLLVWHQLSALSAHVAPPPPPTEGDVAEEAREKPEEIGPVVSLETFIVNLTDPGANRYLRLTMDLELDGKETQAEFTKRLPQVRDAILMNLSTKRVADVATSEGKTALRQEVIDAANKLMGSGSIVKVYFKEFVVQ